MQNTMKQARAQYRKLFERPATGFWNSDAPGLRAFIREHRSYWPNPTGKLARILAA
jgi:hypothetical protein